MSDCLTYGAGEVADLLGVSTSKAYTIIRQLNKELTAKGYITVCGRVSKKYFNERVTV